MSNKNDERILKLKEEITKKTNALGQQPRFMPLTKCIIPVNGTNYNINVCDEEQLKFLLVHLNMYQMSAVDLKIDLDSFKLYGHPINEWIGDIYSKLSTIKYKEEKKKLDDLEKQLTKLLSEEKQTELAIDELASLI